MFNMFEFLYQRDLVCRPFTTEVKKLFGDKPISGVEVGVFKGRNARNMLKHLPNIEVFYLVDPYEVYPGYDVHRKSGGKQSFYDNAKYLAHGRLTSYSDKIRWLQEFFTGTTLPKGLDFIYIDGNHAYEYVKSDIKNALSVLKPGGLLGGHDYDMLGVKEAVSEILPEHHHKKTDWWVNK